MEQSRGFREIAADVEPCASRGPRDMARAGADGPADGLVGEPKKGQLEELGDEQADGQAEGRAEGQAEGPVDRQSDVPVDGADGAGGGSGGSGGSGGNGGSGGSGMGSGMGGGGSREVMVWKDPRLLLSRICHAFEPEAVVHVGLKWQHDGAGLAVDGAVPLEYFVLFAPRDARNRRGACHNLKNSRRILLKAVLRALQAFAASYKVGQDLVVHTDAEVLPRAGRELRRSEVTELLTPEQQGLRAALSPDIMLQIEELVQWLAERGTAVRWEQFAVLPRELEAELVTLPVDSTGSHLAVAARHPGLLLTPSVCPSWYFMRVYTDGSTISVNGTFSGGYGVYFGYLDPRTECGPINGKGTGPRASLVAIVRALEIISKHHHGHRRWEIACNREQYITCVFELTQRWKQSGWKRNSGKPIANLDLYRGARRIIDRLAAFDFELRGTYVPQKEMDRGIMVADLLARRGAGDQNVDLPFAVNTSFEVPLEPEDMQPSVAVCTISGTGDALPRAGTESRLNGSWSIKFGNGVDDPRDRSGSSGSQSRTRTCTTVLVKLLRIIEGEHKRSWIVYVNFNDVLTRIFDQLSESAAERPERRERHEGRQRSGSGLKFVGTPYIDALSKRMRRLERHGYDIKFRPHPGGETG